MAGFGGFALQKSVVTLMAGFVGPESVITWIPGLGGFLLQKSVITHILSARAHH
jgi:hypothetical protein